MNGDRRLAPIKGHRQMKESAIPLNAGWLAEKLPKNKLFVIIKIRDRQPEIQDKAELDFSQLPSRELFD